MGWFENDDHIFIAMEYFQHGTLDRFITDELSELDVRVIALQLLEGLRIMHEEQFAHRDLKPQVSILCLFDINHNADQLEHIRRPAVTELVGEDWGFWNLEARCK